MELKNNGDRMVPRAPAFEDIFLGEDDENLINPSELKEIEKLRNNFLSTSQHINKNKKEIEELDASIESKNEEVRKLRQQVSMLQDRRVSKKSSNEALYHSASLIKKKLLKTLFGEGI